MFTSLERIKQLPPHTTVYCAHEYTQTNGHFAHQYEPNNLQLQQRMSEVRQLRAQSRPTVPTMLHIELATNPFLRPHSHEIRQNLNMPQASELEVFTRLRQLKDEF